MENKAQENATDERPRRVIKRYSNRKLYDTKDSRYVTLLQIAEMVRGGEEVQIIDNNTKEDLTEVTLMSDGVSVYECTSDDEVVDLLRGGQGMFGIALGGVWRDIEGTLLELPAERPEESAEVIADELSQRRQQRATG